MGVLTRDYLGIIFEKVLYRDNGKKMETTIQVVRVEEVLVCEEPISV